MKITRTKLLAVYAVILIIVISLTAVFFQSLRIQANPANSTRVACIGDSLTAVSSYPAILQTMLGGNYTVGNFGFVGSTVLSNTSKTYINQTAFQRAKAFQPDIVVIMLGSNDAHTGYYLSIGSFVADYEELVREFQALASKPDIFLVKPPPIFNNEFNLSNTNLVEGVIPRIEQVAEELGLPTIDAYTPFANHPGYFIDGVHPTQEGARIIASEVYNGIVHASENS
jgi:lysophospholipase L1-like esterase